METFKQWLHGLTAAIIGAAASAASAAFAVPSAFNFSHDGLINFGKLMLLPALTAAAAYLKQSPLPSESQKITVTATKSTTNE